MSVLAVLYVDAGEGSALCVAVHVAASVSDLCGVCVCILAKPANGKTGAVAVSLGWRHPGLRGCPAGLQHPGRTKPWVRESAGGHGFTKALGKHLKTQVWVSVPGSLKFRNGKSKAFLINFEPSNLNVWTIKTVSGNKKEKKKKNTNSTFWWKAPVDILQLLSTVTVPCFSFALPRHTD